MATWQENGKTRNVTIKLHEAFERGGARDLPLSIVLLHLLPSKKRCNRTINAFDDPNIAEVTLLNELGPLPNRGM